MAEAVAPSMTAAAAPKGPARPDRRRAPGARATYADVAARPRWLGVLAVVLLVMATGSIIFFSTDVGKEALLDQQVSTMESFGIKLPDEALPANGGKRPRPTTPYITAASQVVFVPIVALIIAGIAMGIFTAVLGGDATFKQVFSVVAHAGVVIAAQQLFVLPARLRARVAVEPDQPRRVSALSRRKHVPGPAARVDRSVPDLVAGEPGDRAGRLIQATNRDPIAVGLLSVYLVIALIIAGIRTAVAGA